MAHPRLHYYQGKERLALQEQLTRLIIRVIMAYPRLHYYQDKERLALQEQLTRLIIRVIMAHHRLHYYQGKERLALQEQLTRLITRVIMAHPRLHYYQGKEGGQVLFRRSGGLVVSIPATRPPVPGSNLGPSLLTVWSEGQQITL